MKLNVIDTGLTDYADMLAQQRIVFNKMVAMKKTGMSIDEEYLYLTEHKPVVTLGKHAKEENLLLSIEAMTQRGIGVYHIERGGDVTFHGPGQLVCYPIIDLEQHKLGVRDYVELLEESVIRTLSSFGIAGERIAGASGVWVGAGTLRERKICALGVKCSRYITMHGLALNVNTDLSGFGIINPCGFVDKGVTSMAQELGGKVDMKKVKSLIINHFKDLLAINKDLNEFF